MHTYMRITMALMRGQVHLFPGDCGEEKIISKGDHWGRVADRKGDERWLWLEPVLSWVYIYNYIERVSVFVAIFNVSIYRCWRFHLYMSSSYAQLPLFQGPASPVQRRHVWQKLQHMWGLQTVHLYIYIDIHSNLKVHMAYMIIYRLICHNGRPLTDG